MANVILAACFRHYPEDGDTIPASTERQDPCCEWETVVDPIIGFMAISFNGRISWSFVKYEAPDERFRKGSTTPIRRMARMCTTRVGHLSCPECGGSSVYPVWGKPGETRCPACGRKGVDVSYVKETDQEFFELLGDLRDPLEEAVRSVDLALAEEFRFPELMLLGRVAPSTGILPQLQGKAAERGLALRLARETEPDGLFRNPGMQGPDTGLLIMPGITTGILDADRAREGWTRSEGILTESIKLPWLPKAPVRPPRFGGARL